MQPLVNKDEMLGENTLRLFLVAFFVWILASILFLITVNAVQNNLSTQPLGWGIVIVSIAVMSYLIFWQVRDARKAEHERYFEDEPLQPHSKSSRSTNHLALGVVCFIVSSPFILGVISSLAQNDLIGTAFYAIVLFFPLLIGTRLLVRYRKDKLESGI